MYRLRSTAIFTDLHCSLHALTIKPFLFNLVIIIFLSTPCCVSFSHAARKESPSASMDPHELDALFGVIEGFLDGSNWRLSHPHPCSDDILPGTLCQEGNDKLLHVTRLQFGSGISPSCKPDAFIPLHISQLPYLQVLLISECFMRFNTTIPPQLEDLAPSLQELSIRSNDALVGGIPVSLGKLKNLEVLSLSQNRLNGDIPASIGNLKKLQHLDLSYNALSGPLPDILGSLPSVSILDVSNNKLEGTIPSSLGTLSALQKLDLSSNMLKGNIPSALGKLQKLDFLALSNNRFVGVLPDSLSKLQNVEYFLMDNNPFHTTLPDFLKFWQKLTELSLSNSKYVGPIPEFLGSLHNLSVLDLSNNMLSGSIPASLETLHKINSLNLSDNSLSGAIPFTEEFVSTLGERLDLHGNRGLCFKDSTLSNNDFFMEFRSCSFSNTSRKGFGGNGTAAPPLLAHSRSGAYQAARQHTRDEIVVSSIALLFSNLVAFCLWLH